MPLDNPPAPSMQALRHTLETWHAAGFHPHPIIPPLVETRAHAEGETPPKPGKTPGMLRPGETAWTAIRWHRASPRHFAHFRGSMEEGAGVGVRIKTPIGPVRLDLGYPLTRVRDEKKKFRFHFNVSRGF